MKLLDVHPTSVRAPWYAGGETAALHRSFDDAFVPSFLDALHAGRLSDPSERAWLAQDRVADRAEVTLRQPLHRAFYLLSAEVGCKLAGDTFVPIDPAKVTSAGLVIRRVGARDTRATWSLVDGEAVGWRDASANGADPDVRRRIAPTPDRNAPYIGEQVHPMHVVGTTDASGARHTVLYGFMPLSASVSVRQPRTEADAHERRSDVLSEFSGPFRSASGESDASLALIDAGRPTRAFVHLLRVLVVRYRVGVEPGLPENADLEAWLASVAYPQASEFHPMWEAVAALELSLLDVLNAVVAEDDGALQQRLLAEPEPSRGDSPDDRVDALPGLGSPLRLTSDQAETLRTLLVSRYGRQLAASDRRIVVPRFGQGDDDVYVARPFARVAHDGCEHVVWGPESVPFRVAGPFDPELSPAVSIPMPRLADLRRGLAKAEFRLPQDLAEKVLGLKKDDADVVDEKADTFGVQWIVSFSIPIVTICAMILLMIVMAILDMIFKWLPFAIVRYPIFVPRKGS